MEKENPLKKILKTYEILLNAIEEPTHTISPIGTKKVTMKSTDTKRQTAGRTTKCFYVWNRFYVWCPWVAD